MEEARNQFTFYRSFFDSVRRIRKAADRAIAYDIICNYALYDVEPDLSKVPDAAAIAFEVAKANLDASKRKAKAGKAGGSCKQSGSNAEANASSAKAISSNVEAIGWVNQWEDESKNKNKDKDKNKNKIKNNSYSAAAEPPQATPKQIARFVKPSREEVETYCRENSYNMDVGRFLDYYEANGWKVGKNPMKDWKAAVRNWCRGSTYVPQAGSGKKDIPKGASGELGQAELEAIQQLLAEGKGNGADVLPF